MKIYYNNDKDFYDGVYAMLTKGVTFEARHDTLTIELTGGF